MKKSGLILCACLAALMTSSAMAQIETHVWMDVRPNDTNGGAGAQNALRTITGASLTGGPFNAVNPFAVGGVNSGRKGAGTTLYLEPVHASGFHTQFDTSYPAGLKDSAIANNRSIGDLWVYVDVNDDPAGTGDVLASLGLDVEITQAGTLPRNRIASASFELYGAGNHPTEDARVRPGATFNDGVNTNPVWDGAVDAVSDGGNPPQLTGGKAVRVPVKDDSGPTYDATLGIGVNNGVGVNNAVPYRVGRLRVQAGSRTCLGLVPTHAPNSRFNVNLKVNNLLIARVFGTGGDSPAEEHVSFGFNPDGTPQATVSGNQNGAFSALPDAVVEIRMKGDFTGTGSVGGGDAGQMGIAIGIANNVLQTFVGSFTPANQVAGGDGAGFSAALANSPTCP